VVGGGARGTGAVAAVTARPTAIDGAARGEGEGAAKARGRGVMTRI
jgi:hypothetical protein